MNLQICGRRKTTGAQPEDSVAPHAGTQPPFRTPPPPGTQPSPGIPPAPPCVKVRTQSSEIEGMPSRCLYIHSPLPNTQCFYYNTYTMHWKHYNHFIPDLLCILSVL